MVAQNPNNSPHHSDMNQINEAKQALIDWMPDHFGPWLAEGAAKTVLAVVERDWITCPTCGGSGEDWPRTQHGRIIGEAPAKRCPDCVDGMVPSPELVERVRRAGFVVIERADPASNLRWPQWVANTCMAWARSDTTDILDLIDALASRQGEEPR